MVGIVIPTVFKEMKRGGMKLSSSGLGDVLLFAKYVILQVDRPRETFRLAPKVVLKLPTGDDQEAPSLGSGSTDFSFGFVTAWLRDRVGVYADALYMARGKANSLEYGNGLAYNLALAFRMAPRVYRTYPAQQVNAYLELNGAWDTEG